MTLNAATGEISGTPTAAGSTNFEVEVTSGRQTATRPLSISIVGNSPMVLQPSDLCSDHSATDIVTFEDRILGIVVNTRGFGIPSNEPLTCGQAATLTELRYSPSRPPPLGGGIGSLVGMQNLTGLTVIRLGFHSITDISPLGGLTSLTELSLGSGAIATVSLSGFPSLTYLSFFRNSITDISLSDMPSLTTLVLDKNALTTVSLSGFPSLTSLSLNENALATLSLSGFPSLTSLSLNDNSLATLSLSGFPSLSSLSADNNSISAVSFIGLPSLRTLSLNFNSISSLNFLGTDRPSLRHIFVIDNISLTNIDALIDNPDFGDPSARFATFRAALQGTSVSQEDKTRLAAKGGILVSG